MPSDSAASDSVVAEGGDVGDITEMQDMDFGFTRLPGEASSPELNHD